MKESGNASLMQAIQSDGSPQLAPSEPSQQQSQLSQVQQASFTPAAASPKKFNNVRISYEIDAGRLGIPLAMSAIRGSGVSYQQLPSSPQTGRSIGVLDIQYPHPAGHEGVALVGVVIRQKQGERRPFWENTFAMIPNLFRRGKAFSVNAEHDMHEVWVMDIPKSELEMLLARIDQTGFHRDQASGSGEVRLMTKIGRRRVDKSWSPIVEMDALMHRARKEGQLVSYQGAAGAAGSMPGEPASLVALRQMEQRSVPSRNPFAPPGERIEIVRSGVSVPTLENSVGNRTEIVRLPPTENWNQRY